MTFASRNIGAARFGLSLLILMLYGACLFVSIYVPVPTENREVFAGLVGGLNMALGGVVGFYLAPGRRGSSGT